MPEAGAIVVRPCFEQDMQQVALIYAHHVSSGVGSFELQPPGLKDMKERWAKIVGNGWPWLVASPREDITRVVGYAYASQFRERAGYAHCFEDSIYVAPGSERRGVGSMLLPALLAELLPLDVRQVVAAIGGSDNAGSIALHARYGFSHVGTLWNVGWKFGRWHDLILMQRELLPRGDAEAP
jgi:phosphinothricin acetyltransferase